MNINLDLYNIFYAVAKNENITKAGNILHISQPAITKQIKNLEQELGFQLFIRTKRGVILTSNGQKVYEQVKEAMKYIKNIENISNSLNKLETGTLKIGTSKSLTKVFLIPVLEILHKKYPNIKAEIAIGPTCDLIKQLKEGKLDLLFTKFSNKKEDGILYDKIGELHDTFICNNDYKELLGREVSLKEILKYPIILPTESSVTRMRLNNYFDNQFIKMDYKMEVASLSLVANFTKIGYGIGIATREFIKDELKNKEVFEINIKPELGKLEYGITTLEHTLLSPVATEFCNLLKNDKKQ